MDDNKSKVLIIGNIHKHPSAKTFLYKFVKILDGLNSRIYVLSADEPLINDNITWIKLCKDNEGLLSFIKYQLKIIKIIFKQKNNFNSAIILAPSFFLPNLILKILNKKTALFIAQQPNNLISTSLSKLNFIISDVLIVESNNVVKDWRIENYSKKTINGAIYVDSEFFKPINSVSNRKNVVGFVGSLIENKGILEFLGAIEIINKISRENHIEFLIIGLGKLNNIVKQFAKENENVDFKGFISNNDLPLIYNSMRILVLPSYTEGVPNVILESMASGTIVLSSSVGGIPDIIEENLTGFLLDSNTSENIAKKIITILNHKRIDIISKNANELIQREYTYNNALKRYEKILNLLMN